MNWIDFAFLALVIFAGIFGFRKGIIKILVLVSAYLLGTAAAIVLSGRGADILVYYTGISPALARITALLSIFILVSLFVRGLGLLLGKIARAALPGIDRSAGLLLGLALAGILIALAVTYMCTAEEASPLRQLYEGSVISRFIVRHIGSLLPADYFREEAGRARSAPIFPIC